MDNSPITRRRISTGAFNLGRGQIRAGYEMALPEALRDMRADEQSAPCCPENQTPDELVGDAAAGAGPRPARLAQMELRHGGRAADPAGAAGQAGPVRSLTPTKKRLSARVVATTALRMEDDATARPSRR